MQAQISWEGSYDLDFTALSFSKAGRNISITDVCFYNKPIACDSVLRHTGDLRDGSKEGFDEEIIIDLSSNQKLSQVGGFVFVVNSHKREHLSNIGGAKISFKDKDANILKDKNGTADVGESILLACEASGNVAAILWRNNSNEWEIAFPNTPSKGANFQESLGDIQKVVRRVVAAGDNATQVTAAIASYDLQKNETVAITAGSSADEERHVLSVDGDDLLVGCVELLTCNVRAHVQA